ncbi:MAG: ABC transporter permease [Deltaproteobacteria bacterium]|nr:ABC transporter permease [Deltaproteobacteria bacterium]
MLRRLASLLTKEYRQFFRDRPLILIVLYVFTIEIYVAGTGFNIEVRNYPTAVYDRDRTQLSVQLAEKFRAPHFQVTHLITTDAEMEALLNQGLVSLVVLIPEGFARRLAQGREAEVQAVADGTLSNTALLALGYVELISQRFAQELAGPGRRPGVQVVFEPRVFFNPNLRPEWFASLIELFAVITLVSILLPAAAMVREKEYGTLEQLLVTPLRAAEIMLAKVLSMASIVLVSSLLSLFLVIYPVFALPFQAAGLPFFLISTALYVFSATGAGLLIATVCRSLSETILFLLIIIAPILFLSGSWTPLEAMPAGLRLITYLSPLRYYLNLGEGLLVRGAPWHFLLDDFVGLTLLGLALFAFSAWRFRKYLG